MWFKLIDQKWVNQSGVKALKHHLNHNCPKRPTPTGVGQDIKKIEAKCPPKKRKIFD